MIRFLASGFGSGYLPFMPGTWGSVIGLLIVCTLFYCNVDASLFLLTGVTFVVGWICSHLLIAKSPEDTDPSYIVIDEMAGIFLTFAIAEWCGIAFTPLVLLVGFLLFRLFDIVKPFPIKWVDNRLAQSLKTAGLGVMIDDIIAAIPAGFLIVFLKTLKFL